MPQESSAPNGPSSFDLIEDICQALQALRQAVGCPHKVQQVVRLVLAHALSDEAEQSESLTDLLEQISDVI